MLKSGQRAMPGFAPGTTAPTAPAPAGSAPSAKVNVPDMPGGTKAPANRGYDPAFTAIKAMQEAILHFADVASSSDVTSMTGNQTGNKQRGDEYLGGSDPFGNFLASRIAEGDDRAEENQQWAHTDLKNPQRKNTGIADSGLRGMIDDLKRVGTPGKENEPDGIWGNRTDHALKNIRLIVSELLHLSNDMQISIPGLDEKSVETFRGSFYNQYTKIPVGKKAEMANSLTGQINNFSKVFAFFKKKVLENPAYRKYIDQTKSFVQYKQKVENKEGYSFLDDAEKKVYSDAITKRIEGLPYQVMISDLENMNNFQSFMQKIKRDPSDPKQVTHTLQEISQALSGQTSSPPANDNPALLEQH